MIQTDNKSRFQKYVFEKQTYSHINTHCAYVFGHVLLHWKDLTLHGWLQIRVLKKTSPLTAPSLHFFPLLPLSSYFVPLLFCFLNLVACVSLHVMCVCCLMSSLA